MIGGERVSLESSLSMRPDWTQYYFATPYLGSVGLGYIEQSLKTPISCHE